MKNILQVEELVVFYGKVEAVKKVSFEVEESTTVTLIGSNGAGKTTILNAISGFTTSSQGKIWMEDEQILGFSPPEVIRKGIAHVPEGRRVFAFMTVKENLEIGAYLRKDKKIGEDLAKMYAYFPILKLRSKQTAGSLSGGEQQMLAIGRALMSHPKLLLLDEPTLGLAPLMIQNLLVGIITEIQGQGVSIVLVEQNAYLALELAQRGYVLEMGTLTLEGDTKSLLMNDYVRRAYLG